MKNDQDLKRQMIHDNHLSFFLSATEDNLSKRLVSLEEFDGTTGFAVADYCTSPLAGFHPEAVRMVLKDDSRYLGCRANHFVLVFGQSEVLDDWGDCVVCLANHKGGLCITVFTFNDLEDGERAS